MNRLATMPSFIGLACWCLGVAFYLVFQDQFDQISAEGWFAIAYVAVVLAAITPLTQHWFPKQSIECLDSTRQQLLLFFILALIGGFGAYLYFNNLGVGFGGMAEVVYAFIEDPLSVRGYNSESGSAGTQLTFLGWPAFVLAMLLLRRRLSLSLKLGIGAIALALLLANMGFVDRTRPVWITAMAFFALAVSSPWLRARLVSALVFFGVALVTFFLSFALVTGKKVESGLGETFAIYSASGFVYMDKLLQERVEEVSLVRTVYPISKVLEAAGILENVPPQVLEPKFVPMWTNVGTILEPLYSDGGWLFVIVGFPLLALGINALASACLRRPTGLALALYGSLMFTMIIGFFVPKFASTPNYLFLLLAAGAWLAPRIIRRVRFRTSVFGVVP